MLKDEATLNVLKQIDSKLKLKFKSVFVREFPIYWRYTVGEDMLAMIWFKKGEVEIGASNVKTVSKWESNLKGAKYSGMNYAKIVKSLEEAIELVDDIKLSK